MTDGRDMNARVMAHMGAQWGLVTRPQAIAAGMSAQQIDRLVRSRRWTAVRRGVYAETTYVESLATHAERRMLIDRAASLRVNAPHVLSHHSAAYPLQLPVLHEEPPISHLTRPGIVGTHKRAGIHHHLAPYPPDQATHVAGVGVLGLARTALDIARESGYLPGLVAADSALRLGATQADLRAVLDGMANWPYATVMKDVLASACPDTDSIGETLTRDLVTSLGFGVPQAQFGLTANGRTVWCDLRLGRQVFEFDGKIKIVPSISGGYAADAPTDVLWAEKGRQDFVTGFKLGVCRVTWEDVYGRGRAQARERLLREYLSTCARFGTDISDLAQYRPRGPRPRPQLRAPSYGLIGWERWAA